MDERLRESLECGCGTGQMSNFLSVANRTVFGSYMSLHSLSLGQEFKERTTCGPCTSCR